jgi:hypothetical protein
MRKLAKRVLVGGVLLSAMLVAWAQPAAAHEDRKVGKMEFVVGWGDEPAYTGYKNSAQVIVSKGGRPVNDIGEDLKVEVAYGGKSATLQLEPNFVPGVFGEEGDYRAWITPTEAGEYTFRVFGTHDGQEINETFTSGPKTFDSPVNVQDVQFPTKEPSTGELAERTDRQIARLQGSIASSSALQDDLSQVRIVALVAALLAVVALIALGILLMSRRRSESAGAPAPGRTS